MQARCTSSNRASSGSATTSPSHRRQPTNAAVDLAGERIGPYRIVRSLGRGGMGEVFLAERADEQFRQQVAIKLVRRGLLSRNVQGRLKLERQILATLDHPNIARLFDGGTTTDGTPYIVMEYVDGEPIDTYCDSRALSVEQRLRLFQIVCSAVHRAHQNLIVHRDLKPSNILVARDGTPKLLDFGIAKMLDDRQMMHTMAVTQADYRVLTPDHASPEQIRGDLDHDGQRHVRARRPAVRVAVRLQAVRAARATASATWNARSAKRRRRRPASSYKRATDAPPSNRATTRHDVRRGCGASSPAISTTSC